MPEQHAVDPAYLQWLWTTVSIPFLWLWNQVNGTQKKLDAHKLYMAQNTFRKEEVKAIIDGTAVPLKESIARIEKNMDRLINRELNSRKGD